MDQLKVLSETQKRADAVGLISNRLADYQHGCHTTAINGARHEDRRQQRLTALAAALLKLKQALRLLPEM